MERNNYFNCPNCGYQVAKDEFYCPSCHHQVEFREPAPVSYEKIEQEPVVEKVILARALLISSIIFIISLSASVLNSVYVYTYGVIPTEMFYIISTWELIPASIASLWLARGMLAVSTRFRKLHTPAILIILLGLGDLILLGVFLFFYPSLSNLQKFTTYPPGSASAISLLYQFLPGLILGAIGILFIILGLVGLLIGLLRISKGLNEHLIKYAIIVGIIIGIIGSSIGANFLEVVAPLMFIVASRNVLKTVRMTE
ncbi:MAG: zinc ribbon domain-containing protein [Candidatus Thermoplasmatota archaeon]|nr:zinc ribbon domain-containing protein [Candidatus Thermoplasmatota archaeon]MCL6089462.1 zinc ribbon domain-containing protein [Candidatus Thermoplasmatota archaeon]MDA8144105.1 zinc ribbon domain-containing protein [Thermoplasmatales archaeon]